MKRKYDVRNKRSFLIVLIVSIAVVCIFSLFIYKYRTASKIEYKLDAGSVLQDIDKNYITLDDDAKLKIKWNGNYYLEYLDDTINLGKQVIVYNEITGGMKLYGTFYEIDKNGKIITNKPQTILNNTTDTKFYKLGDREYLLVDTKIVSSEGNTSANGYLVVSLDKLGNAKLSNNKINLKTITPTVLVTSAYSFDIANEILNFGTNEINLKKIIGSTNEYKKEEEKVNTSDNKKDDNDVNGNGIGTGNGNNAGNGTGEVINNDDNNGDVVPDIDVVLDKIKMTSVVRVVSGLTQIDVDYVIYDPYNEYKSVYVELFKSGKADIIHLSKNETHVTLTGLNPNTTYKLNFVYTTVDKDTKELIPYTFDSMDVDTLMPVYNVSVYKISKVNNKLTYKVTLQDGFDISRVNVGLAFDYNEIDPETSEVTIKHANMISNANVNGGSYVLGTFDISDYSIKEDAVLTLTVVSVEENNMTYKINSSSSFRFGR